MKTPAFGSQLSNHEQTVSAISGWFVLLSIFALAGLGLFFASTNRGSFSSGLIAVTAVAIGFLTRGFFTLQPNEAAVLTLFGAYTGTVRSSGFFWASPFKKRLRVSLRVRNFNGEKLKVNDKRGNPIEIAVVVVWRIQDTAQATFDVENCDDYVHVQSESALRHVASSYAYDDGERHEISLRGGGEQITAALMDELRERLEKAGVAVDEARLTHLAYAPEIAQAMLRRQQAEAIISARQKIVLGAVSMVDMALRELAEKQVIILDDERKAAMVSNLLVILCGETAATPVINAGTLYS
ncbi:MAG TPA: SPFH domain-containing protein [Opitutaceae bacterium]|jgi:regulator of protease activity HflC (stomatin/prohibitin superfamily)|nr:SPFH domain-containing protein [Opitutaceae bacterium]